MINKVHLIMPMAGKGSRFLDRGWDVPKPLIEINGKPFFYWATRSIEKYINFIDITFVVLKEHVEKFNIDIEIKKYFKNASVVVIPGVLNGETMTAFEAIKDIQDEFPIIINDCDHMFRADKLYDICNTNTSDADGIIITFESSDSKYSYVKTDKNGNVEKTTEKKVISNDAICGAYYFKNRKVFEKTMSKYIVNCEYTELFLSGMYNVMINDKMKVLRLKTDWHISYGVPEEYNEAKGSDKFYELL